MPKRQKLLIATTNAGKFKEIKHFLGDLPLPLCSLKDFAHLNAPQETADSLEANARLKAEYYGDKLKMFTVADDTGLFIQALDGWPGAMAARVGETDPKRRIAVLKKLNDTPDKSRQAIFRAVLTFYNPFDRTFFLSYGETVGEIVTTEMGQAGFGYDPIFYIPELKKTYAELTTAEKNAVSHRGKALIKIKYYLQNLTAPKQLVVPLVLLIKDGKILMSLRHDPHNPAFHKKWEFPGGRVELGETIMENISREVKEEIGYDVEVIQLLQHIQVISSQRGEGKIRSQLYLLPYVCRIRGGNGQPNDAEVIETRWFELEEVLRYDLLPSNAQMYKQLLPELKKIAVDHRL